MAFFSRFGVWFLAVGLALLAPRFAPAYLTNGRWTTTATDAVAAPPGRPVTITWSIVPDGTLISHLAKPSNLISVFDSLFPGSVGQPLAEKPWFALVEQSFDRWNQLSGVTYVYEPADDGANHGASMGAVGIRGDVRLGGANINGVGGALAEVGFIPNADITIDTSETVHFANPGGIAPYINLRSTMMHEIGHTLGLGHSISNNAALLMEFQLQTNFDGPQLDEIRGAHDLYGDFYEKSNDGAGNDTLATATPLGTIAAGQSVLIGADSGLDTVVLASETDFLSISNAGDVDVFSFSIEHPSVIDIVLTPVGATYHERGEINAAAMSNLSLDLYAVNDAVPQLLQSVNLNPPGQPESLLDHTLNAAGTYYARLTGNADAVQLYQLLINVDEQFLLGDFNGDNRVDAADFTHWRDHLGASDESAILNRGDGLNGIDDGDYVVWRANFGKTLATVGAAAQNVPEPGQATSLCSLLTAVALACRKRNILARRITREIRRFP